METERAQVYRQMAKEKADALMRVTAEEAEDKRVTLRPDSVYKMERRDGR
jgi:hypothetical protein